MFELFYSPQNPFWVGCQPLAAEVSVIMEGTHIHVLKLFHLWNFYQRLIQKDS